MAFEPDFILVSAGFDAHYLDHLHRQGETQVTEFDFQWLTENLQAIANRYCAGRLISVLEGGYNTNLGSLSPLAQSVTFHVRALLRTNALAEDQEQVAEEEQDQAIEEDMQIGVGHKRARAVMND